VGKIYTTEFPVAAMARQERTDVRSEVDVIIWDFTGYFGRDAGANHGRAILKNGEFDNRTMKDEKRTNLGTSTLLQWKTRLSAVEGLNLTLLVDTQDQRFAGWIEIKSHHRASRQNVCRC
jgi:hypothetical protein